MAGCNGGMGASRRLFCFRLRRLALLAASIFFASAERIAISLRNCEGGYNGGREEGVGGVSAMRWFDGGVDEDIAERLSYTLLG